MTVGKSIARWGGLGLIVVALLFIPVIPLVPFMPLTAKGKVALTAFLVVGGQVMTWIGAALLGKELVQHYRGYLKKYLDPRNWFGKRGDGSRKDLP
jgi:hypothetical protein